METTAARGGIREIESVAADIKQAADEDGDLISLLQMVDELMTLCRSAQKAYTNTGFSGKISREVGTEVSVAGT